MRLNTKAKEVRREKMRGEGRDSGFYQNSVYTSMKFPNNKRLCVCVNIICKLFASEIMLLRRLS